MTIEFGYDKKQVLDGLRSHFFGMAEIRTLFIVINLFAILSAILFYFKKIQPLPFLIFSVLWFLLWLSIRRLLPLSIYKKSETFQDTFTLSMEERGVMLQTQKGSQVWQWNEFSEFKETVNFFILYFNRRSFFMIPKDAFKDITEIQVARLLLRNKVTK
jgi:YcxB-like protein